MCNRQYTLYAFVFALLVAPAAKAERDSERRYPDYQLKDFSRKSSAERAQELEEEGKRAAEKYKQEHKLDGVKIAAGFGVFAGIYAIWSWFTSGKNGEKETQSSYAEAPADKQPESATSTDTAASAGSEGQPSVSSSDSSPQS